MAVFNPITITENGKEMLTQALAGQGTLTFVSVSTSTSTPSNPEDLTTLTGIKQTVTPASAILDGNVIQVSALFSNSGLTQGYTANSLGLYAKLGDGAQTLFAVVTATEPDVFPAQNAQSPSSFLYQFNISISDTSQITIAVPEGGNLSAAVFYQTFPGLTPPTEENAGDMMVVEDNGEWGYVDSKNAIVQSTATGEFLSFETSLAIPMDNVLLYGKSTQYNTGANLFDISAAKSGGAGDITITDYGTGEFTVSTQNNVAFQGIALKDWCPTLKLNQFCTLSGTTTSADKCLRSAGGAVWNFGETRTISNEDLADKWYFVATTEVSTSGATAYYKDTFSGVMVTYGSTVPPYEVYTAGTGEPSPDTPIPIVSVGEYNEETEKYEVGIGVTGNNLFDINGNKYASESSNTYAFVIYVKQNTEYTLSSNCPNYNDEGQRNTASLYFNGGSSTINGVGNGNPKTVNTGNNKSLIIYMRFNANSGGINLYEKVINGDYWVMLNEGNKPNIYTPYVGQNSIVSISNKLKGIPVDSGGNYTDAEGQQWLCDYIDRERGKYVQCVGKYECTGNESWALSEIQTANQKRFHCSILEALPPVKNNCLNNYFKYKNEENADNSCWVYYNSNNLNLIVKYDENVFTDLDSFKSFLNQRYSEGNPVVFYYALNEPIETDLTQDQIAALNLSTYDGVTNIGTDSNAGIEVEYQTANFATDIAQKTFDLQSTAKSQAENIQALQNTTQTQGEDIQSLEERAGLLEEGLQTLDNIIGVPSTFSPVMIPVVTDGGNFTYTPLVDLVYKIGDIKQTTTNVNPGTYLGGTWVPWGTGRTPVGVDADQTEFNTVEKTGGEITHMLNGDEMPEHDHAISSDELQSLGLMWVNSNEMEVSSTQGQPHEYMWSEPEDTQITCNTNTAGGGQPHNNLQPYITCYYWKRTA